MFGPKSLSYYLFYVARVSTFLSLALICFILLSLATNNYETVDGQFQIALPLLPETYIKGFFDSKIVITITLAMLFFCVFFYLLSNILKTFKDRKLFTKKAIKHLKYFAFLNLVVAPILFIVIDFIIIGRPHIGNIYNYLLTFLLGIFLLFIAAIFNQGYLVQSENDLTI